MIKTRDQIDKAALEFFFKRHPEPTLHTHGTRPDMVIGYREGYEQAIVDTQDIPAIDITTNPEGINVWKELYDRYKETEGYKMNKEIGDIDYMYKWIREKSGK